MKKVVSVILVLALVMAFFVLPANAATYNPSAALSYAANHWNDGVGLCAEFVSNCLNAGGCSAWSTSCTALRRQLINLNVGTENRINLIASGSSYMMRYDSTIMQPGDPIFMHCTGCESIDGKPYPHVVLCNGADSQGYVKAYAHNSAKDGTTRFYYSNKCPYCSNAIDYAYVYHFNSSSGGSGDSGGSGNTGTITPIEYTSHYDREIVPFETFLLTWKAVSGVDHYTIKGKRLNGFPGSTNNGDEEGYLLFDTVDIGKATSLTVPTSFQKAGKWLKFYVMAYDASGKVLAQGPIYLQTTMFSSHNNKDYVDYDDITISWYPQEGVSQYTLSAKRLYGEPTSDYTEDEDGDPLYINENVGKSTSFSFSADELEPETWFKCYVAAFNSSGSLIASGIIYLYINEPIEYVVTYNANGGTGAPSKQYKTQGKSLKLSTALPTKTYKITYNANGGSVSPSSKTVNCAFNNWNTKSSGSGTSYNPGGTYSKDADVTLYAQWTDPTAGTLATPTRPDYIFEGWYTAASGGSQITSSSEITNSITVYAHWEYDLVENYTVTYNANGGTGAPSEQYKMSGEPLILSSTRPTKTFKVTYNANGGSVSPSSKNVSCTFVNWNSSLTGNGIAYSPGDTYNNDADVTLYAQWTNPTAGSLATPTYSDPNYTFEGWYTSANGGTQITSSSEITGNMTIYAHWRVDSEPDTPPNPDADVTFSMDQVSGKPGDTVYVGLYVDSKVDINTIGLNLTSYSSDIMTFAGFENPGEIISNSMTGAAGMDSDKATISIGYMQAAQYSGKICDLKFVIREDAQDAEATIRMNAIAKKGSNVFSTYVQSGTVGIKNYILGDLNGDENVDIDDAVALLQYSIFPEFYPLNYSGNVDFNHDGNIDIDDAVLLLQYSIFPEFYPIS